MGVGAGWYYDSVNDDVTHQNLAESLANAGFGYFHGPYPTEALAIAHEGVKGPAGTPNENLQTQAGQTAGNVLGIPTDRALWVRIAEGVIGVLLILVGVAKLATDSPIARTVAKAGLI